MIITIGGIKGGTGKSMLACNFAVLAESAATGAVLLVDADPQQSATEFYAIRDEAKIATGFVCMRLDAKGLRANLPKLARQYGVVIIDVAGSDTREQREALMHSDRLLAPFAPSSVDAWTGDPLAAMVADTRQYNENLAVFAVLNQCTPRLRDSEAMRAVLVEHGLTVLASHIVRRVTVSQAFGGGLSVFEARPLDAKACAEVAMAFREAMDLPVVLPLEKLRA